MLKLAAASVLVALAVSCSDPGANWTTFPEYPAAGAAKTLVLGSGAGFQRYFTLKEPYPFRGAVEHYESVIREPWMPCRPAGDWNGYADISGEEPVYIHRLVRHWANFDEKRLLLLSASYQSPGTTFCEVPENDEQLVVLVEYKDPNLARTLDEMQLECRNNAPHI